MKLKLQYVWGTAVLLALGIIVLAAAVGLFLMMIRIAESDSGPPQRLAGTDHRLRPDMGSTALPVAVPRLSTVPSAKPRPVHVSRSLVRSSTLNWDALAKCESGGHWNHHTTANHTADGIHWGGLQFDTPTWLSNGGGRFAPRADYATKAQQITIGEYLFARRGRQPWACGRYL